MEGILRMRVILVLLASLLAVACSPAAPASPTAAPAKPTSAPAAAGSPAAAKPAASPGAAASPGTAASPAAATGTSGGALPNIPQPARTGPYPSQADIDTVINGYYQKAKASG